MVRGKIRIVAHRRRREGRTNFHKRLSLVKSGKKRLVVRKTANSLICQVVDYRHRGDVTLVSATAKELSAFGWKGGAGNLPGSYLVGYLCAVRAKDKNINEAILDIGLQRSTKGSRIYAALKGALDGGLNVPFSEDILPSDERIRGIHIQGMAEKNAAMFSGLKKSGLDVKNMSKHFDEVKAKISKAKPAAKKPTKKAVPKKASKKPEPKKAVKKPAKKVVKKPPKKATQKKAKR
jgi:large subunit ribosomal protein L18